MAFKSFTTCVIILHIIYANTVLSYLDQVAPKPGQQYEYEGYAYRETCPGNNFTVNNTVIIPLELSLCTTPTVSYQNYEHHHYGYGYPSAPPTTTLTCKAEKQPCGCNPDICEEWDEPSEIKIYDATCVSCSFCLCYALQDDTWALGQDNCIEVTGVLSPSLYRECATYCRTGCEGPYAPIRQQVPDFCKDADEELKKSTPKKNGRSLYQGPFAFMCKDVRGKRTGPNAVVDSNDYRNCVCSVLKDQ